MEFSLFIEKSKFFYKSFNSYLLHQKRGKLYFINDYSGEWEVLKKLTELKDYGARFEACPECGRRNAETLAL